MFVWFVVVFFSTGIKCSENETFSVFDKLKSGLKLAGKLLVSDHASGVANLVSEAFEKTHIKKDVTEKQNIFSGFLRVLGFDSKKIGAITVNAIIFIAQLISSSISFKPVPQINESRKAKNGSLFEWVIDNAAVADHISDAKDDKLPEMVIEYIKERSFDEDTGCIQLLICKSSPFIRNMQKSINERNNSTARGYKALFAYLPTLEEVSENSDSCEMKYPYCSLIL